MQITIRHMREQDRAQVIGMMRVFYASPAVHTNGSEEIFHADVDVCVGDSPYAEGYLLVHGDEICGYAMLAKSYSTEFGKPCIWIEDIYIKDEYRGCGIGTQFFSFVEQTYPNCVYRLEVEEENQRAVHVYQKCGFETLPYMEMKK